MNGGGRASTGARTREDPARDDYTGEGGPGLELLEDVPDPPKMNRNPRELDRETLRLVHQEEAVPRLDTNAQAECGRATIPTERVAVREDVETGQLYIFGVRRCGNSTSCPTCSHRIARGRAQELEEGLERHLDRGGGVVMVTVTTPHHAGLPCELAYQVVAQGWSRLKASATWKKIAEEIGYVGTVTAHDCTHGPNGWHHHKHALVLTDRPLEEDTVEEIQERLGQRWADRIERAYVDGDGELRFRRIDRRLPKGHEPLVGRPSSEHGLRVQTADKDAAGYVAHTGLTREVTRVDAKKGRQGHRTPKQILEDYALHERDRDLELWTDYARTMARKPAVVWSPGLKERLLVDEQTGLELAQDGPDQQEDREVVEVSGGVWQELRAKGNPGRLLLEAVRGADDLEEVRARLSRHIDPEMSIQVDDRYGELYLLRWNPLVGRWDRE